MDVRDKYSLKGENMICADCIKPEPLKFYINQHGDHARCLYCSNQTHCTPKNELIAYISDRFSESYCHTDRLSEYEQAMVFDASSGIVDIHWLETIVLEHFELGNEELADEVIEYIGSNLEKPDDGSTHTYFLNDGTQEHNVYQVQWESFRQDIVHGHRFFSNTAYSFLDSLFNFISPANLLEPKLIKVLDSGDVVYRARLARDEAEQKKISERPASELGPAPRDRASSQRMTPSGISALYCSFERNTCLSELRPIAGDIVISGAFKPHNILKLLQLNELDKLNRSDLTPLTPGFSDASHAFEFLKQLIHKMSKPKGRQDELSYISTQVVFEYLRKKFNTQIDGITYPSVQTGYKGINLVLFPEHSRVGITDEEWENPDHPPKLIHQKGSLIFHKIAVIQTLTHDFENLDFINFDELTRRRLGSDFGTIN